MSKKKVFTGWIGQNDSVKDLLAWDKGTVAKTLDATATPYLFKRKGFKAEWSPEEWPPKKVRVTVEEI